MKNKELRDIYSDYLIRAFGQTTGTGLAELLGGSVCAVDTFGIKAVMKNKELRTIKDRRCRRNDQRICFF